MFLGTFGLQANLVPTGRHPPTHPGATYPGATHPPTRAPRMFLGGFRLQPSLVRTAGNAKNESFWAHSGFGPIWSEQPECRKRMFLGTFGLQANLVPTGRHPPTHPGATYPGATHPPTHPPTRAPRMFLGRFRLQPNLVRTAGMPKTNLFGHIRASAQFGPNSRNAENECFWAHSGFRPFWSQPGATHPPTRAPPTRAPPTHPPGRHECFWAHSGFSPIWSEQPECRKRMFLGTFGLQANLVPTGRHPPTHPGATYPGATHPPTRAPRMFLGRFRLQPNLVRTAGMPKTVLFGHIRASAQFGPNSRNAENECFWAYSGFRPIWSQPGATHPPTRAPPTRAPPTHPPGRHECFWAHSGFSPIWSEQPECQKRIFLGTFGLRPNLVRTAGMPKTTVFGHIRASGQFGPNRAPPTHPPGRHLPGRHPPTHPGATNVFGHIPASAQFGPNSRNAENECFWAHSGFRPIWSQPGATHPPTRAPPTQAPPPTHQPTHPGATNVSGQIPASAQFGPNSRNAKNESFWAHSGFGPIWSEQPECRKRMFLGTFGLQANLVPTGRHPPTHPGATYPGATHPPTHPPTRAPRMFLGRFRLQPNLVRAAGMPKTVLFGHIRASAQFGPNSWNAENECFWAHSGFRPIWSQPGATHPPTRAPPTRAPPTHPPGRHECFWAHSSFSPIWSEQPECQKRIFLGTFGLRPNLVRTAGMPKTNVFGHIRASGQFGPNRAPPTHPPGRHLPGRHPPTHPGATNVFGHIPASAQFGPNSRKAKKRMILGTFGLQANLVPTGRHPPTHPGATYPGATHPPTHPPTRAPRMFLGRFRLQPNLVRTAGMPKTNVFGHVRASGQLGPNRAPPTHPPGRHLHGRHPPTHPPTHLGATNVFRQIPASAQFGPNSRNAKNESFWAHLGFGPIWSEQPECRKRMFLGTFVLQANLVPTGRHPPTHPGATYPGATHPPTHPPTRAPRMFLGKFRLEPNLVRTAGKPKTNLFGHIRASAQFGPNSRNAENERFWAHSGFRPIWSQPGATRPPTRAPPTRAPPTHPPTHPTGRHECFWADSGFSPIWSEQPECQKRIFLGTFGLRPNLVRTAGMPKTNVFGHIRASGQFGPNRAPPTHPPGRHLPGRHPPTHPPTHPGATNVFGQIPASAQFGPNSRNAKNESFWAHSGFGPIWSEQPERRKRMFLGTFGVQANLVPTGRHPPTHPGATYPGATHPPTHPPTRAPRMFLGTFRLQPKLVRTAGMPKTNLFGHIRASAQFGPNSRNAENECFWAHSGFRPIWSQPGATHPPTRAPPTRAPPTHPPTHPPGRHECFWADSGFSPIWSEQPECQKRILLGTFGLRLNLVRTAGMPKNECFWAHSGFRPIWSQPGATHPPTRAPPTRAPPTHPPTHPPGRHECFWADSGFSPIWSEQPECQKRIFLGTIGLRPNLVRTAGMPKTNVFGHLRASGQFGPNRAPSTHPPTRAPPTHPPTHPPGRHECFWADSGFSPIWSEQPECQKRIFLGTFGLRPNLVRTAGMPKTNVFGHNRASGQFGPNRAPPTHPTGRHLPGRHQPTHPPTHPGATNVFGQIPASAQFGPNSRNAKNESFWSHSGFGPIWSEQPECRKRMFLGTIGLQANFVPTGRHPPTHPGATYPGATHPPTHQPTRAPRMFLGRFRLRPNLVRTAGMPKTNLFGQIRASAQFGPNSRNAENECFWAHSGFRPLWSQPGATHPPNRAPPTRAPPTHPPTHPPGRHECFWANSGFSPIWSEQPECQKRIFLDTFGLRPNLVRTAGMPKTNVFGHIRGSGQFGPNRAPPTHPPGRHLPGRQPPTHPPTHPGAMNVFGQIPASAQFGPNSRNAKNESFSAHSGFSPIWSEQPECQKRVFLGTFGLRPSLVRTAGMPKTFRLQANLVQTGRHPPTHPPTHPGATNPGATHPPTHPPTHPGATNVFGHLPASAQFGPNSWNAKKESFWARWGFSPIWSEQPECRKRMFLGRFRLQANLVRTGRNPPTHPPTHPPGRHPPGRHPPTQPPTQPGATNVFGHIPASAQFGPNSRKTKTESFWARSGFSPI